MQIAHTSNVRHTIDNFQSFPACFPLLINGILSLGRPNGMVYVWICTLQHTCVATISTYKV